MVEPTSPRADGPLPTIAECDTRAKQIELALRVAKESGKTKSVAILFKNREQERLVSSGLPDYATKLHRDMNSWNDGPGIYYGTYHSAKGLEFDLVILPFLDKDNLPDPEHIASHGEEDALTHDGRLLYVAVTRARMDLLLLYTGEPTPLLPAKPSLYGRVSP
jgi:superfamily I DNA/RNA helicase